VVGTEERSATGFVLELVDCGVRCVTAVAGGPAAAGGHGVGGYTRWYEEDVE
jgi:hypothetical protein